MDTGDPNFSNLDLVFDKVINDHGAKFDRMSNSSLLLIDTFFLFNASEGSCDVY